MCRILTRLTPFLTRPRPFLTRHAPFLTRRTPRLTRFRTAADLKPVVGTLSRLFDACAAAAAGHAGKRREMDDNSKKLGGLLFKLNLGDVSRKFPTFEFVY
jgi:hypothetical protein